MVTDDRYLAIHTLTARFDSIASEVLTDDLVGTAEKSSQRIFPSSIHSVSNQIPKGSGNGTLT